MLNAEIAAMTSRRELSYALSLIEPRKWGTARRCFDLIAAASDDDLARPVELSSRDMAEWLGLSVGTVLVALRRLRRWGMVEFLDRAGQEGSRWRIVDPLDWAIDAPWSIDRREVVINLAAFSHLEARAQNGLARAPMARALALLRREKAQLEIADSGDSEDLRARLGARANEQERARSARARKPAPLTSLERDPSDLSINIDGEIDRAPLSERGEALAEAIREATGKPVVGALEARIGALADRCNGSFPAIYAEAQKRGLTSAWTSLTNLERLADRLAARAHEKAAARRDAEPSQLALTNRLSWLQQRRRELDDLDAEETRELIRLSERFGEPMLEEIEVSEQPLGTIAT